ncbi:DsbA family protein [Candidatus Uhrbacteria bacterium]|nr:DsbA family protein [Candidatus Uhrbacteria bacterium]
MQTHEERWSAILILSFLFVVVFLTFHLYLSSAKKEKNSPPAETSTTLSSPRVEIINPVLGPPGAIVTLVEFGDFACPACADTSALLESFVKEFEGRVRVVWKDFPNEDLHPSATDAAVAARCAQEQGAFWPYHDLLFTQRELLSATTYTALARTLKLNTDAFDRCVNAKATLPRVQKDFEEGLALSISATPTVFVGTERLVGTPDAETLRALIQQMLTSSL